MFGIFVANCTANDEVQFRSARLAGIRNNAKFELNVVQAPRKSSSPKKLYWGGGGLTPSWVVERLEFAINGKPVLIPKRAFDDLAEISIPFGIGIENEGSQWKLRFMGGDGESVYDVSFMIVDGKLIKRELKDRFAKTPDGMIKEITFN